MPNDAAGRIRLMNDPVHESIVFTPRVCSFIDTPQFQRLRYIKQLAACYYVWPGASHNRFEHCIGVAHLARTMAMHLQTSQPELNITDRDVECVELAGLCHDLGHGPWSHAWDTLFMPQAWPEVKWTHEMGSEMMFDHLIKENQLSMPPQDAVFIKALIRGDHSRCPQEKTFLFDIVANERNGIDVDKFDYILRDSHMIGDKGNILLSRIMESARVIENQICYDIKSANQIYDICTARFSLHKKVYNHKTTRGIEHMIIDAILAAEPFMQIAKQAFDPEEFLYLTDDLMSRIERDKRPELAPARHIFNRIHKRDLYRAVDNKTFDWENLDLITTHITPSSIVEAAKARFKQHPEDMNIHIEMLDEKHVIVDLCVMHYGKKAENPLNNVKFYSKHNKDECYTAKRGDMTTLMPSVFAEILLRVYTREPEYFGIIQAGYRSVLQSLPYPRGSDQDEEATLHSHTEIEHTPPTDHNHSKFIREIVTPPPKENSTISRKGSRTWEDNTFTTVLPTYVHTSPTKPAKRAASVVEDSIMEPMMKRTKLRK